MENIVYKCPNCASSLIFDSASGSMKCQSCESVFSMETLEEFYKDPGVPVEDNLGDVEKSWKKYGKLVEKWSDSEENQIQSCSCNYCGAEIITEGTASAGKCPYCGNPTIFTSQFTGSYRPDFLIPFKTDKKNVQSALEDFTKGKKLLPDNFKVERRIKDLSAIYIPYWLFDCNVDAEVRYNGQVVSTWSDSQYRYTKTDQYLVLRSGNLSFEKIPVDGLEKIDSKYTESVEPYNYQEMVPFTTGYLSGYLANKFDISPEESIKRASERLRKSTETELSSTVRGYTTFNTQSSKINLVDNEVHFALLPMWIANTKHEDKMYTFAMNGQTGKFVGELPISKSKVQKYFLIRFIMLFVIFSLLVPLVLYFFKRLG